MTTPPPPRPGWNEPIPLGQGPDPAQWQTSAAGVPMPPVDQSERSVPWPFVTGLLVVIAGITVAVLIGAANSTTPATSVPIAPATSTTTATAVVVVRTGPTTTTAAAQNPATTSATTEKQAEEPGSTSTSGP